MQEKPKYDRLHAQADKLRNRGRKLYARSAAIRRQAEQLEQGSNDMVSQREIDRCYSIILDAELAAGVAS